MQPGRLRWRPPIGVVALAILGAPLVASPSAWSHFPSQSQPPPLAQASQEEAQINQNQAPEPPLEPTPEADCGPGSRPETGMQGRVSPDDYASGRAAEGFTCNTEVVGSYTHPTAQGTVGGFRVNRYVDAAGHECAYYDTTLLFPTNADRRRGRGQRLDMSDPAHPALTDSLRTPAMLSPHESLSLNEKRGLLVAVMRQPRFLPGIVDVYDVTQDCRHPVLQVLVADRRSSATRATSRRTGAPSGRPRRAARRSSRSTSQPVAARAAVAPATTTRTGSRSPTTATAPTSPGSPTG